MKKVSIGIVAVAMMLTGCAQWNSAITALSSPQFTQALANIKAGTTLAECALADLASIDAAVNNALASSGAVLNKNYVMYSNFAYVTTNTVCNILNGTPTGATATLTPAGALATH